MNKKIVSWFVVMLLLFQLFVPITEAWGISQSSRTSQGSKVDEVLQQQTARNQQKAESLVDQTKTTLSTTEETNGLQETREKSQTGTSVSSVIEPPKELLTKELFLQTKIGEKKQNITIGEKEELTLAVPTPVQSDQQTFLLQPTGEKNFQLIYAKENLLVVPQTDQTLKLVANTETDHATLEAADWQLVAADQVDAYYLRSSLGTLLSWDEATQRLELKPAGESDNLVFQLQLWPETETTDPSVPPTPEESTPAKKPSVPEKTDSEEDPGGTVPIPAFAQSQQIAAGVYQVTAAGLTKGLALTQRSTANGVGISLQPTNTSFLQQFEIEPTTDGWYLLKNSYSGKYLDIPNASRGNSIALQQYTGNQTDAQKFKFLPAGNGQVYIQSKLGTVLDRRGGASANGTVIQTYQLNETVAQKWQLTKQAEKKLVDVKNGEYQLTGYGTDKVLSIGSLTGADRTPTKLITSTYSGADKFLVEKQADGWYILRNSYSGKSLDVTNESSSNGAVIQQYTSKNIDAQKFRFIEADQGYVYLESKLGTVIERPGGSLAEGLVIKTYQWNQTAAQKWKLESPTIKNEHIVAQGEYYLTSNGLEKGIALSKPDKNNQTRFVLETKSASLLQRFQLQKTTDGWYTFKNSYSGKYLDISNGNKGNGIPAQQYSGNQSDAQKFKFIEAGNNSVYIYSKLGTVLERRGGSTATGTLIQTYQLNQTAAQKWQLETVAQPQTVMIPDGEYQITGFKLDKVFSINETTNANRSILLKENSFAKIDLFSFERQADGWYKIRNSFSGKTLTIANDTPANGAVLQQADDQGAWGQKFRLIEAGDGYVYLQSALGTVLERPGGNNNDGLVIKTYQSNQTNAQKWKIEKQKIPASAAVTSGARYFITAGNNSNAVLEVSNGSGVNGARVQIWTEAVVAHQKFIPEALGDGWFKIKNAATGKVLDVTGGSKNQGTPIQQYSWNGTAAQQFRFIPADNGAVFIQSRLGTYLDITGGNATDGTSLQTYVLNKTAAQQFKLTNLNNANTLRTTVINKYEAQVTLYSPSTPNGNLGLSVEFPTWSRDKGQDDLQWLKGTLNADQSWSVKIKQSDFSSSGTFDTHAYIRQNNQLTYVAATNYSLAMKSTHLFVMGHGGWDPGALGSGTNERDFTRNELLPILRKYAARLKKSQVVFYDPSRDMYTDSKNMQGAYTVTETMASVTELHLDAGGTSSSGGHVIVSPGHKTAQNNSIANLINRHVGWHPAYRYNNGLSERTDLLNLNVFRSRGIPYRLVEMGFITNQENVNILRRNKEAICQGLIEAVTGEAL